jgi:hypothetical protein
MFGCVMIFGEFLLPLALQGFKKTGINSPASPFFGVEIQQLINRGSLDPLI